MTANKVAFGSLPVGTIVRLENCYGTKIDAIQDEKAAEFYRSQKTNFVGWNFRYKFMGFGQESFFSLEDNTEVVVLDKLPECYSLPFNA